MRTVTRALAILDLFSESAPRLRLADVVRLSGVDKATCHRMLRALQAGGYLDQSPADRRYCLGPAVLRLARMREALLPTEALLTPLVQALSLQTQETSHASLIAGNRVVTVASAEGPQASRVHVEAGGMLSPGFTASGLVCLVWGPEGALAGPVDPALFAETRRTGYACARGTFDPDVLGIGAPIFGAGRLAIGAVAVASPISRMTPAFEARTARAVLAAAAEATRLFAGAYPPSYPIPSGH